jgi:hypothetical protein
MDEKYPDHRTGDKDQDIYAERAVVHGPVTDPARAAAETPLADAPLTGDARVDAAIAGLSRLAGTPPQEHVAVLEEAHGRLRDILGELAEGQR